MDLDENTLGADLLSEPKARVLRRSRVMELSRCFIIFFKQRGYLSQAHPFDWVHVLDFDMQVSPQAFPALHHLQQLALSVKDSSSEPVHKASSACKGNMAEGPIKDFRVAISSESAVSSHLTLMLAQLVA